MKNKQIILVMFLVAIFLAIIIFVVVKNTQEDNLKFESRISLDQNTLPKSDIVYFNSEMRAERESYLKSNISELSPTKEVLGGKFYITEIKWLDSDKALISYEDGHIVVKADIIFVRGNEIASFLVLPEEASPSKSVTEVRLSFPEPGAIISSPLEILGEARGNWFFEANIPVSLVDEYGNVIASVGGQAQLDWMTEDFVPFKAVLEFATEVGRGELVIAKDNPSGLSENDASVRIPVRFK